MKVYLDNVAEVCILLGMKLTPETNSNTKKRDIAFYTLGGTRAEESLGDAFLRSIGVDLSCAETDALGDEFYTTFMLDVSETKAKDLKHMRSQLRAFTKGGE